MTTIPMSHDRLTALESICASTEDSIIAKQSRYLAAQELEAWATQLIEFGNKTPGTRVDEFCRAEAARLRQVAAIAKAINNRQA